MGCNARRWVEAFVGGGIVSLVGVLIDEPLVRERALHDTQVKNGVWGWLAKLTQTCSTVSRC